MESVDHPVSTVSAVTISPYVEVVEITQEGRDPSMVTNITTTSFTRQQLDLHINDFIVQVSKNLAKIIKSMVHNKMHFSREETQKRGLESPPHMSSLGESHSRLPCFGYSLVPVSIYEIKI